LISLSCHFASLPFVSRHHFIGNLIMEILVIAPRYNEGDFANNVYMFPLGLGYISAILKQAGHRVNCLNLNHMDGKTDHLVHQAMLANHRYDFVCTGGLSNSYRQIKVITDAVHETETGAGIVLGGGMISSEPQLMFEALKPDYMVIGEGEITIQDLLDCIENNGNLDCIPGIGYRDKRGHLRITKNRAPIANLDALPWPDFEGFEFQAHLSDMRPTDLFFYDLFDFPRVYPIIGSRGCPFLCTFCYHPLGRKYRQRSIESIMSELEVMVKKYQINIIAIYDEIFTYDQERVFEFCKRIKELIDAVPWDLRWNCQMRVDGLDENSLRTMKEAGCHMVSYGFESYSTTVLKSMRKHITPEQITKAIEITKNNSISLQANFIFGDSAETSQTAKETLDYWKKEIKTGIQLSMISAYPGTKIYQHAIEQGMINDRLEFISNPTEINTADAMSWKDFKKLKFDIFLAQIRFRPLTVVHSMKKQSSEHIHGSIKSTYEISVYCPHCNEQIQYKNYLIQFGKFFLHTRHCRSCYQRFFMVSRLYKITNDLLRMLFLVTGSKLGVKIYAVSLDAKSNVNLYKPLIKRIIRSISVQPKSRIKPDHVIR